MYCYFKSQNKFTFNENDPENKNTVGIRAATRNQLKAEATCTTWNDIYIPVNLEQIQKDDPDHETRREQKRPDFHQIQT